MIIDRRWLFPEKNRNWLDPTIYDEIEEARLLAYGTIAKMIAFYSQCKDKFFNTENFITQDTIASNLYTSKEIHNLFKTNFFNTLAGDEPIIHASIVKTCLDIKELMISGSGYEIKSLKDKQKTLDLLYDWIEKTHFNDLIKRFIDIKHVDGTCIVRFKSNELILDGDFYIDIIDTLDTCINDIDGFIHDVTIKKCYKLPEFYNGKELWYFEIYHNKGINYEWYLLDDKGELKLITNKTEVKELREFFGVVDVEIGIPVYEILKNNNNPIFKNYGLSSITPITTEIIGKIESDTQLQLATRESKAFLSVPKNKRLANLNMTHHIDQKKSQLTKTTSEVDIDDAAWQVLGDAEKRLRLEYANKIDFFQPNYSTEIYEKTDRKYLLSIASSFNIPNHFLNIDSVGTTGEGILNEKEKMNRIARQNEVQAIQEFITNILNKYLWLNSIDDEVEFIFNDTDELTDNERLLIAEKLNNIFGLKKSAEYYYENNEEIVNEVLADNSVPYQEDSFNNLNDFNDDE